VNTRDRRTRAEANGNGYAGPGEGPPHDSSQAYAAAVARIIHGRELSAKSRAALEGSDPPEWGDLARYLWESPGFDTSHKRAKAAAEFITGLGGRRPPALVEAMRDALKAACDEDPGDEPDDADGTEGRRSFLQSVRGITAFDRADFRLDWHVRRVLVAGQPVVVGAPKKSLKTSVMIDMAVSLAGGLPFLGAFEVPAPVPVLILSGESGGFVMQETVRRVCRAKGIDPELMEGYLFVGDQLPQLGMPEDLDDLAAFIVANGIKVVIVDPLYLCLLQGAPGRRLDPSNIFDVGPLLLAVSRACLGAGATPALVHHFKKNGADPHDLPELEELAYAGIQEFARQWGLLKRRKRFEPGSGVHNLWMVTGGSAGHSGEWALDVNEGRMDDDFRGRVWEVSVTPASEARWEENEGKQSSKAEQAAEKAREADEVKAKRVRDDAVTALMRLDELVKKLGRPQSKTEWKESLHGWNSERFGHAFSFLLENEMITPESFTRVNAQGRSRAHDGFRPAASQSEPDAPGRTRTYEPSPAQTRTESEPDGVGVFSPVGRDTNPESGSLDGSQSSPAVGEEGVSGTHQSSPHSDPAVWEMKVIKARPEPRPAEVIKPRVEPQATVYFTGAYGQLVKEEGVRFVSAERTNRPSYSGGHTIECWWRGKGKRRACGVTRRENECPYLLVLRGDRHPDVPGDHIKGRPGDPKRTRYPHLWVFDERIDRHIAETEAEVLVDWRDVTKGDPNGAGVAP
jgi:replicative DNA helicase